MASKSEAADELQTQRKLGTLQDKLESFIENLRSVGVIAGDFQHNGQIVLNDRLNRVVEDMRNLDRMKEEYAGVQIPLSVLNYIDTGRNPELFTRHQLEQTLSDYEAVQRKVQAYKQEFRAELIQQLQKPFEAEIAAYLASCPEEK
ncbi:Mediator of RNA polymerase II transcription subunit 10 [Geodia barretti]|uniref:Mediator of RNA polymerase II transcription subunit 10 n=1 Tax=Geodia barretti TaxID=519541 RepID=A0AA35WT61_GEOBA|nr:Mediator of RNA polymerase II transcription subunit 10 [Geodia barretti]